MRTVFKTSYDADINLFRHGAQRGWYILLLVVMLVLPLGVSSFAIGEMTNLLIWSIACMGLMILVGQTGQASLLAALLHQRAVGAVGLSQTAAVGHVLVQRPLAVQLKRR